MQEPTYRQTLKEAWQLVAKNTSLWLLGLLSVLFAGSFGLGNFLTHLMFTMGTNGRGTWFAQIYFPQFPEPKLSWIVGLIWLCGVMIAIFLAVIFISVTAKTALLIATADYYKDKTIPKLNKIWNSGLKYFWKIFSIEVFRKIALCLVALAFGLIWYILPADANAWSFALDSIMLIFALLLGWIISAVSIYASGYTVIDGKSLRAAYKKGWRLFHKHLMVSFEISLILTVLDILLVLFFSAMLSFSFIPSIFIWMIAGTLGSPALAVFGAIFGVVIMILALAVFGAIYNTFYTSVWMNLFMKMHHEGIASRIMHHLGKWFR